MAKTVRMIALRQHVYDNVVRKAGEQYDVVIDETSYRDVVGTLVTVGHAKILDLKPEDPADPPKGKYNRRDMRAQGS